MRIEAAEMRFLRPTASSDKREQLSIFNINEKLTQYKRNRREHNKEWMTKVYVKKI